MLQVIDITKSYTTGDFTQTALNQVTLSFRKNEFVAILGPSGSGKTTFLNVIGGLDRYDKGDLIINGKSTKKFTDSEWDAYRNNSVGFVFQNYNLIHHLNIVDNVELGMTLSGVPAETRHKKALEVLEKVGLKEHRNKKPNQLSGGQMQRVAIARALANNPDIILADEPTGALDSATSKQILDLIKEIAHDKLVIMVTHNAYLAERYADRIIRFEDGKVISDSNPYDPKAEDSGYSLKKTGMSFPTALKISGKNISTKKWRTALTAFATSIGIIGIALILSLSTGFQTKIDEYEQTALAEFPILISQSAMDMDAETMRERRGEILESMKTGNYPDEPKVFPYDTKAHTIVHTNVFTEEYLEYIYDIDPAICSGIGYTRMVGMNLLRDVNGVIKPVSIPIGINSNRSMSATSGSGGMDGMGLTSYPERIGEDIEPFLEKNYDLLAGSYPKEPTDVVLVIDEKNRVDSKVLENLGFDVAGKESISFDEIVGTKLMLISNDRYYTETPIGSFMPGTDYEAMYNAENSLPLTITGILRLKPDETIGLLGFGIVYSDDLVRLVVEREKDSKIVKAQREADHNVITMEKIEESAKRRIITYLGGNAEPSMIYIIPRDFDSKKAVLEYLDAYNIGKSQDEMIIYTDLAGTITEMTEGIMNAITLVLIAFAAISLVVSLIMIGIITYISVLERTKEIGILRAVGARKKDITRVFNAETFIIGALSGLLGIGIAYLLNIPINSLIYKLTDLQGVAQLHPLHAFILISLSLALTLLGGFIPAKMAATKDPVVALRTE
jgi:putative ABC transport system permease protein